MYKIELRERDKGIVVRLEINSEIARESHFGSHLLTRALVELIQQADVSGWEKYPEEELQPFDFFEAVVGAVASNLRLDLPAGASLREAMIDIVDSALTRYLLDDTFGEGLDSR